MGQLLVEPSCRFDSCLELRGTHSSREEFFLPAVSYLPVKKDTLSQLRALAVQPSLQVQTLSLEEIPVDESGCRTSRQLYLGGEYWRPGVKLRESAGYLSCLYGTWQPRSSPRPMTSLPENWGNPCGQAAGSSPAASKQVEVVYSSG